MRVAQSRSRRAPMLWKVPAQGKEGAAPSSFMTRRSTLATRRSISWAARRENVSISRRWGSAPCRIRCATRCARVLVLPDPAPAITSRADAGAAPGATP